jgi:hypothetical protein
MSRKDTEGLEVRLAIERIISKSKNQKLKSCILNASRSFLKRAVVDIALANQHPAAAAAAKNKC